jgi:phage gp29-like protein
MSRRKQKGRQPAPSAAFADEARKNLPAQARTLIASVANDITVPVYSDLLTHADDTLIAQGQGRGLAIYDEVERDTHAGAMLEKRRNALISRNWEVEPGGDRPADKAAADLVDECLQALPFDRICKDLLNATLKGFAVAEAIWAREGSAIRPVSIVAHDQRRFVFDRDWQLRLLTWDNLTEGEPLPGRKFIVHRVGVRGNNPYGLGLGSKLFWPVLFKREGVAFWLHFLEKYAGPTVVGKTPYGMLSDEQSRLLQTLVSVRTSSAVTVPIGTDIEFLEASRSGSVTYEQFLAYWDKQISIAVTGETLTTQVTEGGGNRALGEVHQEQLDILADSDGDLLTDTLRDQLAAWIVAYNLPGAAVPSIRRIRPKNEMAEAETRRSKADAALAVDRAITAVVRQAARFEDDQVAREYIVSFEVTDALSDKTIDALVAARGEFAGGEGEEAADPDPFVTARPAAFAGSRLKKKR